MSYRPKLLSMPKEHDAIRDRTHAEWWQIAKITAYKDQPCHPAVSERLYELPLYWTTEDDGELEAYYRTFDVYEKEEAGFHIISQEQFKQYIEKVVHFQFTYLMEAKEEDMKRSWFTNSRWLAWSRRTDKTNEKLPKPSFTPIAVNIDKGLPFESTCTEFDIFNLILIYREFDWDNNHLIYGAW